MTMWYRLLTSRFKSSNKYRLYSSLYSLTVRCVNRQTVRALVVCPSRVKRVFQPSDSSYSKSELLTVLTHERGCAPRPLLDGVAHAMEMHLVHLADDGDIAVVGVLFKHASPSSPPDPTVAKLLAHVAADGGRERVAVKPWSLIDRGSGYYEWRGSLTTPPCTGDVRWMLQREVRTVSAEQCAAFRKHVGTFPGNARPTQPLNGRAVRIYQPRGDA